MTALHHPGLSALLLQVHQFQEAVNSCSWCAALADALQLVSVAKPSLKPSLIPSYAWESLSMDYSNLQLSKIYLKLLSSVCHSTFFTIPKIIVSCRVSAAPSRRGAYAQGPAFCHLEYVPSLCLCRTGWRKQRWRKLPASPFGWISHLPFAVVPLQKRAASSRSECAAWLTCPVKS